MFPGSNPLDLTAALRQALRVPSWKYKVEDFWSILVTSSDALVFTSVLVTTSKARSPQ